MARPRKTLAPSEPVTEHVSAPVPAAPVYTPAPRRKQVERQGSRSEPFTRIYPQVRGGICEFCGVLDKNTPSQYQYKMCGHYRGLELRCSYCPDAKDPDEIAYHATLNVHDSPDGQSLIVVCDSYECSNAHIKRFQRSAQ